ncbi:hypothetical protein EW145_g3171 [Phellinidium pouzarii]|uniref:Uncharacterized protein n=1 Tax=Phellinidium pouzarii TaxID=167371 RepID=A0A4S4L8J4_9AGAM|nr:hypothetical protein EW145_g3171 [Phellinidium pouzarii]
MAQVIAYNFTVDDTSPQIIYSPPTLASASPDPDLQGGWNQYFNGSGYDAYLGQVGLNTSLHITSRDNATFSIAFKGDCSGNAIMHEHGGYGLACTFETRGTAIQLYGLAIDSSFSLAVDDEDISSTFATARRLNSSSDPVLLASISGLAQQDHILSFTAHTASAANGAQSSSVVIFDRAVVTVSTGLSNATVSTQVINDTEMQFTGSWTFVNDSALVPEGDHTCHITQTSGDQARYSFQGSSVQLGGLTNATSGLFNIALTSDSDPSIVKQQQISSFSSFLAYTTLFYASGLERNATHILTVTNLENKTLGLDSLSIMVVSGGECAPSASTSSQSVAAARLSRGEIAAISVVSSLAFLVFLGVALILLCCYKRRRRSRHLKEEMIKTTSTTGQQSFHRSMLPREMIDVPRAPPGQGPSSHPYDQPAPAYDQNMVEIVHVDEDDGETDSGLGHGQKKRGSVFSMSHFNTILREPPTPRLARPRSLTLSRWSGWFTSSTRRSSSSSRQRVPAMSHIPIVSPLPVRVHPQISLLARAQNRASSNLAQEDAFLDLDILRTSPFQVDFEKHSQIRGREPSDLPRISNAATLSAHARDMLDSFLDFASSGATSLRESSRSRSRRHSGSNKSTLHSGNNDKSPGSRHAQESSGQSQSASTGMWTLSLSVDPPLRPARESQQLVPTTAVDTIPSMRHPFSMVSDDLHAASPESPTDSIPMSISDINFNSNHRTEEEDEDTTAERIARFHLPRHPPLPGTPRSYELASPIHSPQFERATHMRQMSAPNLGLNGHKRPYGAQTSFGRRLAQVRAQALESQRASSQPDSPSNTEQNSVRLSSSRARILPLPFINFRRSTSGSR